MDPYASQDGVLSKPLNNQHDEEDDEDDSADEDLDWDDINNSLEELQKIYAKKINI